MPCPKSPHIRKEEAQRRFYWQTGNRPPWLVSTLNRWLTNHGESLWQLSKMAMLTIIACGLLYPFVGGINDNGTHYTLSVDGIPDLEVL